MSRVPLSTLPAWKSNRALGSMQTLRTARNIVQADWQCPPDPEQFARAIGFANLGCEFSRYAAHGIGRGVRCEGWEGQRQADRGQNCLLDHLFLSSIGSTIHLSVFDPLTPRQSPVFRSA